MATTIWLATRDALPPAWRRRSQNAATPFTLVKIRHRKPSRERIAPSSGAQFSGGSMRMVGSATVSAP